MRSPGTLSIHKAVITYQDHLLHFYRLFALRLITLWDTVHHHQLSTLSTYLGCFPALKSQSSNPALCWYILGKSEQLLAHPQRPRYGRCSGTLRGSLREHQTSINQCLLVFY